MKDRLEQLKAVSLVFLVLVKRTRKKRACGARARTGSQHKCMGMTLRNSVCRRKPTFVNVEMATCTV